MNKTMNKSENTLYKVSIKSHDAVCNINTISKHSNPLKVFKENITIKAVENIEIRELMNGKYIIRVSHKDTDITYYTMTITAERVKANSVIQKAIEKRLNSYGYDKPVPDRNTYYIAVRQVIKLRLGKCVSQGNFYENEVEKALAILDEILPRK